MKSLQLLLLLAAIPAVALPVAAQEMACSIPAPQFISASPNIFNDKQEQDLGDALAEMGEPELTLLPIPPAKEDQLTQIGQRLLAQLPPTSLHYQFRIYDSGEINAFSTAGGRVYISRKLITAVSNEDELAGVVAHEIGHISTHQNAISMTRILRIRLGVTQVGDRADIFAKIHQLFSTPAHRKEDESSDEDTKDEMLADHVAIYAMNRAGYQPESFIAFFNTISLNKGKTGGWLSDMFGITGVNSQRYRTALKLMVALPEECKQPPQKPSAAFQSWQKNIVAERVHAAGDVVSGDRPLKLNDPLRPMLWHIRFSPNGHFVLAQDESNITVIDRDTSKVLFQIDADDAEQAQFTPDSTAVVFHDTNLRVEQWDIATGKQISVKEMVVYEGCVQTLLSPDGRSLVCLQLNDHGDSLRVGLRLIDVASGKVLWEKPGFFSVEYVSYSYYPLLLLAANSNVAFMLVSQDERYLLVTVANQVQAFDLQSQTPVELGGKIKEFVSQTTLKAFVGPHDLLVATGDTAKGLPKAQVLSFPDGRVVKQTQVVGTNIQGATKGHLLILRPLKEHAAGILDYEQGKILGTTEFSAMDLWDTLLATENGAGDLYLGQLGTTTSTQISLPLGQLPGLQAGVFSPDGRYLAISLKSRGEVWDLETGKKLSVTRPFRSAWMDSQDDLFAQFLKYQDHDAEEVKLHMTPLLGTHLAAYENHDWQYHDLQYHLKPDGKGTSIDAHATLEVKKMETQAVAWSRDYPHETPACWSAEDDRLVLAWDLSNETAKADIKNYPALQKQFAALKNAKAGLLIETVVPETGAPLQQVIIPEADLSHGWDDLRRAWISGNYALVRGEHGNTVIYTLDSGTKVGEFFGFPLATDAASGLIAAGNREGEVMLLNESNGKELQRFMLGSAVRAARIVSGKEKELFVLTSDQVVHRLPLPIEAK